MTDVEEYERPAWWPRPKSERRATNIEQILSLRPDVGTDYADFYDWSIGEKSCEDYWDTLIKRLKIKFEVPYRGVFDASGPDGVKGVQYLPGARLNVAGRNAISVLSNFFHRCAL